MVASRPTRRFETNVNVTQNSETGVYTLTSDGGGTIKLPKETSKEDLRKYRDRLIEGDKRGGRYFGSDAAKGIVNSMLKNPVQYFKQGADPLHKGANLASFVAFEDDDLADIWLKEHPNWTKTKDAYGHLMVKNKKSGQRRYVNPAGLDSRDIHKILGDLGIFAATLPLLPAAPVAGGLIKGGVKLGAREALRAGAETYAQNVATEKLGAEDVDRLNYVPTAMGVAGATAALAPAVAKGTKYIASKLKRGPKVPKIKAPPNIAAGEQLDDLLTRGQRTGDTMQLASEKQLFGEGEHFGARKFYKRLALEQPSEVQDSLVANLPKGHFKQRVELGDNIVSHIRHVRDDLTEGRLGYRTLYKSVEESGVARGLKISQQHFARLSSDLDELVRNNLTADKTGLEKFANRVKTELLQVGGAPGAAAPDMQQVIQFIRLADTIDDGQQRYAAGKLIRDWLDDAIDKKKFFSIPGPWGPRGADVADAALINLKEANRKRSLVGRHLERSQNPVLKRISKNEVVAGEDAISNLLSTRGSQSAKLAALDDLEKLMPPAEFKVMKDELKGGLISDVIGKDLVTQDLVLQDLKPLRANMNRLLDGSLFKSGKLFTSAEKANLLDLKHRLDQVMSVHDAQAKVRLLTAFNYMLRRTFSNFLLAGGASAGAYSIGGPVGVGAILGGIAGFPAASAKLRSRAALTPAGQAMQGGRVPAIGGLLGREAVRGDSPSRGIEEELKGLL